MDVGQLGRELKAGTYRPAYLVSGPDTYLAEEAIRALLESLLPPEERELGLIRLYADQVEVEEVLDEARTIPFFGPRRLVVVRQVEQGFEVVQPATLLRIRTGLHCLISTNSNASVGSGEDLPSIPVYPYDVTRLVKQFHSNNLPPAGH